MSLRKLLEVSGSLQKLRGLSDWTKFALLSVFAVLVLFGLQIRQNHIAATNATAIKEIHDKPMSESRFKAQKVSVRNLESYKKYQDLSDCPQSLEDPEEIIDWKAFKFGEDEDFCLFLLLESFGTVEKMEDYFSFLGFKTSVRVSTERGLARDLGIDRKTEFISVRGTLGLRDGTEPVFIRPAPFWRPSLWIWGKLVHSHSESISVVVDPNENVIRVYTGSNAI